MSNHEVSPIGQTEGEMSHSPFSPYNAIDNLSILIADMEASSDPRSSDARGRGLLGAMMSRRRFMRLGLGAGLALTAASFGRGDFLRSVEAAGEINYGLPVAERGEDIRLVGYKGTTIKSSHALDNPENPVSVASLELNSIFSEDIAKKRANLAGLNNGLRNHYLSTEYLQGEKDPSRIVALLESGQVPPEPDWAKYFDMIQSGADLTYDIMALPHGVDAIPDNVDWRRANPLEGTSVIYSDRPGVYEIDQWTDDNGEKRQGTGVSLIVDSKGKLTYEVYSDIKLRRVVIDSNPNIDPQRIMNLSYTSGVKIAYVLGQMTLGIFENKAKNEYLWNRYLVRNYSANDLALGMFPDQQSLIFGEKSDYSEALVHVNFSLPHAA